MIVLVGFMGAGKSTVGRMVADELGLPFSDSDSVVEQRAGRSVPEVFATDGEETFRWLERVVVADLLAGPSAVLALGGGALQHPSTRVALRDATVVLLSVSLAEAVRRAGGGNGRPLLHRPGVEELYETRLSVYAAAADVVVATDDRSAHEVARAVLARVRGRASDGTSGPSA